MSTEFSELLSFWPLSFVRYPKKKDEPNVSETDPVSGTLCYLVFFRIPDDGQCPKTQ
jgi:hypothetical protein